MKAQKKNNLLRNQKGFTLIEIIAVLIILGILAAVAIPKYMGLQEDARNSVALGQISEVKGRLSQAMARYMLANNGDQPANGEALRIAASDTGGYLLGSCPATSTIEGDFTFSCTGSTTAKTVTISVTAVQGTALTTAQTRDYTF